MSIACKDIFMQGGRANGSAAEQEGKWKQRK